MVQSILFIVLVAELLINNPPYCCAENVYCVTPTASSCSSCPHNSTHCSTLSEYAQEAELYFTANTTMVFLLGDHILDKNITVANKVGLTMRGESSSGNTATVVCNGPVGLNFTNMVKLKLHSLAFASCSRTFTISKTDLNLINSLLGLHYTLHNIPPNFKLRYALLLKSTKSTELVNCSFRDTIGTALAVLSSINVTLTGNTDFTHNYCEPNNCVLGGGINALLSSLTFIGNTTFLENNANFAGAGIFMLYSIVSSTGNINFINNLNSGQLNLPGLNFPGLIYNTFLASGTIWAYRSSLHFSGVNNFINNSVQHTKGGGGAIYALAKSSFSFTGVSNFKQNSAGFGGAIYAYSTSTFQFTGITNFSQNSAYHTGGAILASYNSVLTISGKSHFISNYAFQGGAIFTTDNINLTLDGTIFFTNNTHTGENNYGGGLFLNATSTLYILPNTTVYWKNNHATLGGAIYVNDQSNPFVYCNQTGTCTTSSNCFFQLPGQNHSKSLNAQLIFENNSAGAAGSVLYGGAIDSCTLAGLDSNSSGEVFDMLAKIEDDNTNSSISSLPFHIRPCKNNRPDYNTSSISYGIYPGETFYISVAVYGQRNGTVPSRIRSYISTANLFPSDRSTSDFGNLLGFQYIQPANNLCSSLNYTVFSLEDISTIVLYADGPCSTFSDKLTILLAINHTCPPGFNLSKAARACLCEQRLERYTNNCNITNGLGRITRDSGQLFWVGYDQYQELILHPVCPFDYCLLQRVVFPFNNTDAQCAYNRSSLLCGACKKGYSMVLGTSHCKACTNSYLILLIPFAVMGVALVFLLLVCKLTVATGTLSGLLFYANIVGVNRRIFLPEESTDLFSIFVAWLNLDFGIETCFFDGMDSYSKTWLQFVFPVYIWLLVGLMILVSNFSRRFAKLLGNNPVSVLATLILLSYTKILRTLITAFYVTYLEYPTYNRSVWLYDANIDYLSGKHIPLFVTAMLVFIFLFLPYTLLLLFGQWLQAISHLRLFSWVNSSRLKPFLDAYHAPYKAKHRYWPGLLLILRFVLLLVVAFQFNPQQDTNINLLAILVGSVITAVWAWTSGGVYKNWCLDALEGSFALNLIILAASTMYTNQVRHSEGSQVAVGYTSVSIALATFIGILVLQLLNVTGLARYLKRKCTALKGCIIPIRDGEVEIDSDTDSLPDRLMNPGEYEPLSQTAVMPTESNNDELNVRKLIPAYTYSSIN